MISNKPTDEDNDGSSFKGIPKAAVIAIGTEVTDGEILNSNSTWISKKLEEIGVSVQYHLSVPDDEKLILDALEFLSGVDFIFTTGGLGPTSDDFTRNVISKWSNMPLKFDEGDWENLVEILNSRGLVIRDEHRNECMYPDGAFRIDNPKGTANGFYLKTKGIRVIVLPGPPREIKPMWDPGVLNLLKLEKIKKLEKLVTWNCFGIPESEVAALVESVCEGTGLRIGYRASLPYVKVKVWFPEGACHPAQGVLNEKLSPWIRSSGDPLGDVIEKLWSDGVETTIEDHVTGGRLSSRVFNWIDANPDRSTQLNISVKSSMKQNLSEDRDLGARFIRAALKENQLEITQWENGVKTQKLFNLHPRLKKSSERSKIYLVEEIILNLNGS